MAGKMKFDIALEDEQAAEANLEYQLKVFTLPGPDGTEDGAEEYAAVRPDDGAFLPMLTLAHELRANPAKQALGVMQFLDACMDPEDLRAALIENGGYEPDDGDRDPDLSLEGVTLASTAGRLAGRLGKRRDKLGPATLVQVMIDLIEEWSGNPTGSASGSSRAQRRAGAKSTARNSSAGSTSSRSTARAKRGSSTRSTSRASAG